MSRKEVQHFGKRREIESVEVACTPSDGTNQETVEKIAAAVDTESGVKAEILSQDSIQK